MRFGLSFFPVLFVSGFQDAGLGCGCEDSAGPFLNRSHFSAVQQETGCSVIFCKGRLGTISLSSWH